MSQVSPQGGKMPTKKKPEYNPIGNYLRALTYNYVRERHPEVFNALKNQAYLDMGISLEKQRPRNKFSDAIDAALENLAENSHV